MYGYTPSGIITGRQEARHLCSCTSTRILRWLTSSVASARVVASSLRPALCWRGGAPTTSSRLSPARTSCERANIVGCSTGGMRRRHSRRPHSRPPLLVLRGHLFARSTPHEEEEGLHLPSPPPALPTHQPARPRSSSRPPTYTRHNTGRTTQWRWQSPRHSSSSSSRSSRQRCTRV
jgi:hypothetical protein